MPRLQPKAGEPEGDPESHLEAAIAAVSSGPSARSLAGMLGTDLTEEELALVEDDPDDGLRQAELTGLVPAVADAVQLVPQPPPGARAPPSRTVSFAATAELEDFTHVDSPQAGKGSAAEIMRRKREILRMRSQTKVDQEMKAAVAARAIMASQRMKTVNTMRRIFKEVDTSGNGLLELSEFKEMIKLCSIEAGGRELKLSHSEATEAFKALDMNHSDNITYRQFEGWFQTLLKRDVRAARMMARQLFLEADKDKSDSLDQDEVGHLMLKCALKFPHVQLNPPFDLDRDFQIMSQSILNITTHAMAGRRLTGTFTSISAGLNRARTTSTGSPGGMSRESSMRPEDDDSSLGAGPSQVVCWDAFEDWWRMRTGDDEGKVPVLPESMVMAADSLAPGTGRALISCMDGTKSGWKLMDGVHSPTNAKQRWAFMTPRLKLLVHLGKTIWGDIGDLYDRDVFTQEVQLQTPYMRHPQSSFTKATDMISTLAIIYTVIAVPFRLSFGIMPDPASFIFWFDAMVDLVFIVDIILNFRTAYFNEHGLLEQHPYEVAHHYITGWFFVDFLSSIPFTMIATLSSSSTSLAGLKWLRMTRLFKMMTVTRIMKVLDRHAGFAEFTVHMSSMLTFITIAYGAHLLACGWYLLGSTNPLGWVHRIMSEPTDACPLCPNIHVGNRYAHSMYTVFKMGDNLAVSAAEKGYAVMSEGVIIIIQGALAGLMSQLMMSQRVGEQEYLIKLAQLKAWMKSRRFTRDREKRIMKHFTAKNQSSTFFDERTILSYLPVSLARDLAMDLYKPILTRSPLFRWMSKEVLLEICERIIPQSTVAGHTIFKRGDVGHEMYFVMRGEVEVTAGPDCDQLGFVGTGGFFGEKTIIQSVRRCYGIGDATRNRTVRATTDCELAMLRASDVLEISERCPELEVRLKQFTRAGAHHQSAGAEATRMKSRVSGRKLQATTSMDHVNLSAGDTGEGGDSAVAKRPGQIAPARPPATAPKPLSGFERKAELSAESLIAATGNDLSAAMERLIAAHKRATASLAERTEAEIQLAQAKLNAPAEDALAGGNIVEGLEGLAKLHESGALDDTEFALAKRRLVKEPPSTFPVGSPR